MRKWILLLIFYVSLLLLVYQHKDFFIAWLYDSNTKELPFMFLFSMIVAIFPVIPFTIFAGLMGVKYGWFIGSLINLTGGFTAAMLFFFLSRYFFSNYYRRYISNKSSKGIGKLHLLMEKNAFIAILMARILPIIPTPLINIYSGISRIPIRTYVVATAIGQYPGMFIYAFMGDKIFTSWQDFLIGVAFYIIFSCIVLGIYFLIIKNKKDIIPQ